MSNYLDDYVGVWERWAKFVALYPDYRHKSHVLAESLTRESEVYIVKTELYRTWNDTEPFATGLSSEVKSKQYAIELAETGSLGRALQMANFLAKPQGNKQSHIKPVETTNPALGEFLQQQRPNDPPPVVWDVSELVAELGAEIVDEVPLCNHGPMVIKQGTKEGKEYRGWVCGSRNRDDQCPAKWMKIDSTGKWVFKK